MQELLELVSTAPLVLHISRAGARMELVESQPVPAAAPHDPDAHLTREVKRPTEPHTPASPKKSRKARIPRKRPGPKPKRGGRRVKGPLSIACTEHKVEVGVRCSAGSKACRDRRRQFREASSKSATSAPAAIPRRMKRNPEISPAAAAPTPPKNISKETAATRQIAKRIAGVSDPEEQNAKTPEISTLAQCPHCGEGLSNSRYNGVRCRNAGCDLFGEDLTLTRVSREGCNCVVCVHARELEAADLEPSTSEANAMQGA